MDRTAAKLLIITTLGAGCFDPAGERARRDLDEVGRHAGDGLAVTVEPGAVLELSEAGDAIRVRAGAPVTEIEVAGSGPELWLTVENVMPGAEVSGAGVLEVEAPTSLSRRILVRAPAGVRIAPPDVDDRRPVRFGFVSDYQGNDEVATALAELINADPAIEFLLCAGDIVDKGDDVKGWSRMQPVFDALAVPMYATNGNHELYGGGDGAEFHRRLGRMNYTFDYRGVRFALADTGSATMAERVFDYLDERLGESGAEVRIFVAHIPPIDPSGVRNGGFSSRLEAERVLAMLARRGVDLTLYGHIHTLEMFANAGIPAVISGGGGGWHDPFDGFGYHLLVMDVDPIARRASVSVRSP